MTAEELVSLGLRPSKAKEWAGTYTWTFEDGKATTRAEGIAPYYCEGTYSVVEDMVRFTYTPESQDCAGNTDYMRWRLDDDGLHLQLADTQGNAPFFENKVYLEAKPWQKVD